MKGTTATKKNWIEKLVIGNRGIGFTESTAKKQHRDEAICKPLHGGCLTIQNLTSEMRKLDR